jgi:signal transduction histidine kinase
MGTRHWRPGRRALFYDGAIRSTGAAISEPAQTSTAVETLLYESDWTGTLGPRDRWPQSLRATIKLILSSKYPMVLLWTDTLYQIYNDAYVALIGGKHPHAFGRSIRETQPESWDVIGPMIRHVMTTRISNWVPNQQLALNRAGFTEEAYFSLSYSAVEDDDGAVKGMLCVCSETTQQVLGERRLRLQRELSHAGGANSIAESCREIAGVFARFAWDVPFACIFLRREEDPDRLDLVSSVGFGDNADRFREIDIRSPSAPSSLARVLAGETVVRDGVDYLGIAGGPFASTVTRAVAIPIRNNSAEHPVGVLVIGVNPNAPFDDSHQTFIHLLGDQVDAILQNARAYENERRRAEELDKLNRAKTAFFSNVSHEFRTPLTLLLGPLDEALAASELPGPARDALRVAQRNGYRLLRLVNTLLDFSRIEAGRADALYEETDLGPLTADLASNFRSACERAGLALDIDCAPGSFAHVDRQMWEKIVLNLVSNAFKVTLSGGIGVSLARRGQTVVLQVSDTGTGISPEDLPRVFERFYRAADSRGRSFEGTGIGLALVKELVDMHGGEIAVESTPDAGTTFTVTLPAGSAHLPADRIAAAHDGPDRPGLARAHVEEALQWLPSLDGPTGETMRAEDGAERERPLVLLADDNADMRHYVERLLRQRFEVLAVADGDAALEALAAHAPDLALLDVMMPRRDGFEVLAHIRAQEALRTLPVILLSARAGEEVRVEGIAAGADDYLIKPFDARELVARVEGAIRLSRERRRAAVREAEARHAVELATGELRRKDDMIAEINHRVKNNLQFLSSLIALTARELNDPRAHDRLRSLKDRVVNLGLVHTLLYDVREDAVELDAFLGELARKLVAAYGETEVALACETVPLTLHARRATTLGLLVNEAILNALKHAFAGREHPLVRLSLSRDGEMASVSITDNGRGHDGRERPGSSGMRLMSTFARQLGGALEFEGGADGTTVRVRFPIHDG